MASLRRRTDPFVHAGNNDARGVVARSERRAGLGYRDDLEAARRRADALERDVDRLRRSRRRDRGPLVAIAAALATALALTGVTLARRRSDDEPCTTRVWREDAAYVSSRDEPYRLTIEPGPARCLELRFDRSFEAERVDVIGSRLGNGRVIVRGRRVRGDTMRVPIHRGIDEVEVFVHRRFRHPPLLVGARVGERIGHADRVDP